VLSDFQNFYTAGKRIKFATNPIHYPPHLRHVVGPIPWEIKNSNFHRYLADMEENANKMHYKCSDFNSSTPTHVTVYVECFKCFYQNLVLVAECHVDCWQTMQ